MPTDERSEALLELQKEWRKHVTDTLDKIQKAIEGMNSALATQQEVDTVRKESNAIRDRVEELEKDKAKLVGGLVALQAISVVLIWIFEHFGK